jgi:hypothetical protein
MHLKASFSAGKARKMDNMPTGAKRKTAGMDSEEELGYWRFRADARRSRKVESEVKKGQRRRERQREKGRLQKEREPVHRERHVSGKEGARATRTTRGETTGGGEARHAQKLRGAWARYSAPLPATPRFVSLSRLAWPVATRPAHPAGLTRPAVREFVMAGATFPGLAPRALCQWHPGKFWPGFEGRVQEVNCEEGVLLVAGHLCGLLEEVQ